MPDAMHDSESQDDAALIARCRQGDGAAWAALVRRYQRIVYAIVRRAGADEHAAADVFQTVFSRLLEHLPRLTQPDRLQAWIVTTAKREALRARHLAQRTVSMTRADDATGAALEDTLRDDAPLAQAW
jgi:RNA polymerase sigma factor (sigma-70 family)